MSSSPTVAIIGAGCTGLAAIKSCLEENLQPTCFESSSDIGGLWRFRDDVTEGRGSVMASTVINTSKEMMAFSDFPPPREFPNFLHHTKVIEYFRLYAARFQLVQHIHFHTEVIRVRRTAVVGNSNTASNSCNILYTRNEYCSSNNSNKGNNNRYANAGDDNVIYNKKHDNYYNRHIQEKIDFDNRCNIDTPQIDSNHKGAFPSDDTSGCGQQRNVSFPTNWRRKLSHYKKSDMNDTDNNNSSSNNNNNNNKNNKHNNNNNNNHNNNNHNKNDNINDFTGEPGTTRHGHAGRARWEVTSLDKRTGLTRVQYFDFLLVCTGHHAQTNLPYFPGQSLFKGRIVHSRDLRRANEMAGSRHVVVGVGNSGCDAAVEMSRHSKVFLSTRRGAWIMTRLQKRGLPADIAYTNRLVTATAFSLPTRLLNTLTRWQLNSSLDHSLYGLRPEHGPLATHPTVNDELPNRMAAGHVILKPDIESFTETGVCFDDGTTEDNIDSVVMATGYTIGFSFLDQSELQVQGNRMSLYLHMFPPSDAPPTLAIIGCVQPGGAIGPVSEMQCRLATKVFKREVALPSRQVMLKDIEVKRRALAERYIATPRHTVQVDYIPYMDELAARVGCAPRWGHLLLNDPGLLRECIVGPCTPYQYRLHGPGRWVGARDAIRTQMDRVRCPFSTRPLARGRPGIHRPRRLATAAEETFVSAVRSVGALPVLAFTLVLFILKVILGRLSSYNYKQHT